MLKLQSLLYLKDDHSAQTTYLCTQASRNHASLGHTVHMTTYLILSLVSREPLITWLVKRSARNAALVTIALGTVFQIQSYAHQVCSIPSAHTQLFIYVADQSKLPLNQNRLRMLQEGAGKSKHSMPSRIVSHHFPPLLFHSETRSD